MSASKVSAPVTYMQPQTAVAPGMNWQVCGAVQLPRHGPVTPRRPQGISGVGVLQRHPPTNRSQTSPLPTGHIPTHMPVNGSRPQPGTGVGVGHAGQQLLLVPPTAAHR